MVTGRGEGDHKVANASLGVLAAGYIRKRVATRVLLPSLGPGGPSRTT
jgi:hypothetical protein